AIRQKRGLVDNWNELPRNVLISDTGSIELRNACFNGIDPDTFLKDPGLLHEFSFNGDQYTCSGFHILNRANQGVATLVIIQNVNQFLAIGQGLLLSESTIISIVFLIFVFLLVVLINRTVLAPVQSLVSASRKIAAGSYGEKSNFRSNDEIGKLTENFNGMSEKLAKNYQQLKENGDLLSGQVKIISEKNAELRAQEERLEKTLGKLDKKNNELHILTHDLEKFKLALDNASDYVTITDPEAKILYLNSAAKAVSATCQVGEDVRHMWQGLMGQAFIDRLWRTIKYDKKNFTSDLLTMTEAGKELEVRLSITPIVDENGAVIFFVSICRDISEEKAVEKAKSDFVSLTSHQLRTPLTSIKWLIELLLNPKNGKLNRKQRDFLKTAYASTKRLMFLIGDLLSVSHIETGKINLNTKLTSIGTVLKSILQDLEPQISSKELAVSLKLAKNVPEISVDNNLIKQALTNIISNSVKYTPEKGKVGISTKKAGESLVIEITDNGLGIPQEEQKDIFKRFFRASNVQTEFTDGTGLGLFISQSLVGLSGGTISFQSTVGKGTTFWVTLPLNQNPVQ
ncbi:HAMP domain-containing protein, partial [Patescibacteria group bacterium]